MSNVETQFIASQDTYRKIGDAMNRDAMNRDAMNRVSTEVNKNA